MQTEEGYKKNTYFLWDAEVYADRGRVQEKHILFVGCRGRNA